jgi:hypothetical protein
VIEKGNEIVKKMESESGAVRKAIVEMNEHKPLLPGALPNPPTHIAISFRNAYLSALPLPTGGGVMKSRFAQILKAGMPPTVEEITLKQTELAKKIRDENTLFNSSGQPANLDAVNQQIKEETTKLPKTMMEQTSKSCRVYVSPDTFEIYQQIAAAVGAPDPVHMYYAQLGYWIQEDVVNAINEINGKSQTVLDSPVKWLVSIRAREQGVPTFKATAPGQATGDPDAALPKEPRISPTGRVCNGMYDVFHFDVKADIEADKLSDFLRGLGNRRFITPLWVDIKAVDNAASLAQGHAYGEKPVINVTATCEVLYLRLWNQPLMPTLVKQQLGIEAPPAAAVPAQ